MGIFSRGKDKILEIRRDIYRENPHNPNNRAEVASAEVPNVHEGRNPIISEYFKSQQPQPQQQQQQFNQDQYSREERIIQEEINSLYNYIHRKYFFTPVIPSEYQGNLLAALIHETIITREVLMQGFEELRKELKRQRKGADEPKEETKEGNKKTK